MKPARTKRTIDPACNQAGFTMIEVILVALVSALLLAAIYKTNDYLQNSSLQQVEINRLQQNQRGAMAIMERELRMAGEDRTQIGGTFQVRDVRRFDIVDKGDTAVPDASAAGSPILRFTADLNSDGNLDGGETVTYLLYDRNGDPGDGFDLARSTVFAMDDQVQQMELLAGGIDAISFAYAFDRNLDGLVDRTSVAAGSNIIWGVDTDNDNLLDADTGGNTLGYTVDPKFIRSVRIWILGRAQRPDPSYANLQVYTLGHRTFDPPDGDKLRRWLTNTTLHLRNL
jgi:prepilin-type N-terminal cleavage/methylation domain-containing protein